MKELYPYSINYAVQNNEISLYRESLKENIRCSSAIAKEINENYDGKRLDSERAVEAVLNEFEIDRISYVLANTIKSSMWDGRYSQYNKLWAIGISTVDDSNSHKYKISVHPGLIDLFANKLQEVIRNTQLENSIQQPSEHYPSNPHVIKFKSIEIFGHKALFTNCKLVLSDLPKDVFCYELRDDGHGNLNTLEPYVRINFAGSVITSERIPLTSADGLARKINNNDLTHTEKHITLSDFMKESGKNYTLETNAGYEIIEHHPVNEKTSFAIGFRKKTLDCNPFVVWRKNDRGYDGGYYCDSYDEAKKNQIERIQRVRDIESPTFSI